MLLSLMLAIAIINASYCFRLEDRFISTSMMLLRSVACSGGRS